MKKGIFNYEDSDDYEQEESIEEDFENEDFQQIVDELQQDDEESIIQKEDDDFQNDKIQIENSAKGNQMKELIEIQQNINVGLVWSERIIQKVNRLPQRQKFFQYRKQNRKIVESTMMNALLLLNDALDLEVTLHEKFQNKFSVLQEQKQTILSMIDNKVKFENRANDKTKNSHVHKLDLMKQTNQNKIQEVCQFYKQKTLQSFRNLKKSKSDLNLNKNPFEDAENVKNQDDYQIENLFQIKPENYQIIGKSTSNDNLKDVEVFEDPQLKEQIYNDLIDTQKIFFEQLQGKIIFKNTEQFLKGRKKKIQKDIDRRATKHRKINYQTHEKLINFMTGIENYKLMEDREKLLKNLFGQQSIGKTIEVEDIKLI